MFALKPAQIRVFIGVNAAAKFAAWLTKTESAAASSDCRPAKPCSSRMASRSLPHDCPHKDVDVVMVAPKGLGAMVRREFIRDAVCRD